MKKYQVLMGAAALFLLQNVVMAGEVSQAEHDALKAEVKAMRAEMSELRRLLKHNAPIVKSANSASKQEVESLQQKVKSLSQQVQTVAQDNATNSSIQLSGYASAGFTNEETEDGRFDQVKFSPIFHYQYKDLLLVEAELEFEVEEDGETEVELEYMTLDLMLNDYATLVMGKFLSPIGQFRQNLHPSWINKLPSAPPGFGHEGAAPEAEIGMQVRGGNSMGENQAFNYAVYVGNGPELELEGDEIEGIETEGFARDLDHQKVYGGRFGFLPMPKLEIGLSAAGGNVALEDESDRNYRIYGADFGYQWKDLDFKGEYVEQKIASLGSSAAPGSFTWKTWYLQSTYKFPNKFEGVLRYGDFDSPHNSKDQTQWTFGLNYLFAPQLIAKIAYELNDGKKDAPADNNRVLGQIAYGF